MNLPRNHGATQSFVTLGLDVLLVIKVLKDLLSSLRLSQARVENPRIVGIAPAEGICPASKQIQLHCLHSGYNNCRPTNGENSGTSGPGTSVTIRHVEEQDIY